MWLLHRPRVGLQEAHNLSDVQRFYIIMAPTSRKDAPIRLAAVGKKQLPKTKGRFWACIQGLSQKVLLKVYRDTHMAAKAPLINVSTVVE